MVDIHSHILWGLDDGAHNPEETLEMARVGVENGITHVIATPHHYNGTYSNPASVVYARIEEANELLRENHIPLVILPGMEIYLNGEIGNDLDVVEQTLVPLGGNSNYLLIEFPYNHVPRYTERLFFDIQLKGFVPIIAHPERNIGIRDNPNILYELIKKGALSQVTAASVAGFFGDTLQKLSLKLIKNNLVHFIASDAHNVKRRGFVLREAHETIDKKLESSYTDYFLENAQSLIENRSIHTLEPHKPVRKKIFGLF